jgi:hypothetical protein
MFGQRQRALVRPLGGGSRDRELNVGELGHRVVFEEDSEKAGPSTTPHNPDDAPFVRTRL